MAHSQPPPLLRLKLPPSSTVHLAYWMSIVSFSCQARFRRQNDSQTMRQMMIPGEQYGDGVRKVVSVLLTI